MLYHINHPYYPKRNKGIDLFVVSIIIIVTGIYDSRWRASSRSRLPAIGRKYIDNNLRSINHIKVRWIISLEGVSIKSNDPYISPLIILTTKQFPRYTFKITIPWLIVSCSPVHQIKRSRETRIERSTCCHYTRRSISELGMNRFVSSGRQSARENRDFEASHDICSNSTASWHDSPSERASSDRWCRNKEKSPEGNLLLVATVLAARHGVWASNA